MSVDEQWLIDTKTLLDQLAGKKRLEGNQMSELIRLHNVYPDFTKARYTSCGSCVERYYKNLITMYDKRK